MGEPRERNIAKVCGYCGGKFMAAHPSAVYCSDSCRKRANKDSTSQARKHNARHECVCCYCGKHFLSQQRRTRFCCNRCRAAANKDQRMTQNMHTEVWDVDPGYVRPPNAIGIQDLTEAAMQLRQLDIFFAAAVYVAPPDYRGICDDVHELLSAGLRRLGQ